MYKYSFLASCKLLSMHMNSALTFYTTTYNCCSLFSIWCCRITYISKIYVVYSIALNISIVFLSCRWLPVVARGIMGQSCYKSWVGWGSCGSFHLSATSGTLESSLSSRAPMRSSDSSLLSWVSGCCTPYYIAF